MYTWLESHIRSRFSSERGQADLVLISIVLFLLWLVAQGRRIVVQ